MIQLSMHSKKTNPKITILEILVHKTQPEIKFWYTNYNQK